MKHIELAGRLCIAKLCVALLADDLPYIVALQEEMGFRTARMDPWVLERHARLAWDTASRQTTGGLNIQLFVEALDRRDPVVANPDDGVLSVRMCMMLWGLCYHLQHHVRVCEQLGPTARELLAKEAPQYLAEVERRKSCGQPAVMASFQAP